MRNSPKSPQPTSYEFIPFPDKKHPPQKQEPIGHDRYDKNPISGTLRLTLTVRTPVHVSTGVVAMGSDVGENRIPLIKLMATDAQDNPIIPGSSLKGVVRSVYETITNSTLGVVTKKYKIPKERQPCKNKKQLCPASRVFGALNWQGVVQFRDARCIAARYTTGFMRSLYSPNHENKEYVDANGMAKGRKFYYHTDRVASPGQKQGIPVQQAGTKLTFTTEVQLTNLTEAELGVLFIALGQDPNYPMALKIGGGKSIGMGTMTVEVTELEKPDNMSDRYLSYDSDIEPIVAQPLKNFIENAIQKAHEELIYESQLEKLHQLLKYRTDRQPPEVNY